MLSPTNHLQIHMHYIVPYFVSVYYIVSLYSKMCIILSTVYIVNMYNKMCIILSTVFITIIITNNLKIRVITNFNNKTIHLELQIIKILSKLAIRLIGNLLAINLINHLKEQTLLESTIKVSLNKTSNSN
jgi:hypothetical protein